METKLNATSNKQYLYFVPLLSSIILTLFLFFIDEGYYSFKWMMEPGAWIVFTIYVALFFLIKISIIAFFFNFIPNLFRGKLALPTVGVITFIGACLGILLAFYLFRN